MVDLLAATGYLAVRDSVTEPAIERHLWDHAADVDFWELESMDTRCAPAWAFAGSVVTRIPGGPTHTFRDRFEACAFYVARFIEEIAARLNVDHVEKAHTG